MTSLCLNRGRQAQQSTTCISCTSVRWSPRVLLRQELSEECTISVRDGYLACKEIAKVVLQRLGGYFGRGRVFGNTLADMPLSGFGVDSVL